MLEEMSRVSFLQMGFLFLGVLVGVSALPQPTFAVLPPDVLFSLGSQVGQAWAFVGAIVLGTFASITPMISQLFHNTRMRWLFLFCATLTILALWSYGLLHVFRPQTPIVYYYPTPTTATTTPGTQTTSGHQFYSDRFMFVGHKTNGEPLVLEIFANRVEQPHGSFLHYYLLSTINAENTSKGYESQLSPEPSVLPTLLFTTFARQVAPDHSSRERFNFSFTRNGVTYSMKTSELQGDFLVKNEPENTEYISVGDATVQSSHDTISGKVLYQRIYSTDSRPTIFFEGFNELKSDATQIVLWDEVGTFYLLDKSRVTEESPHYSSHLWALRRNLSASSRKAFTGVLLYSDQLHNFTGNIPELAIENINVSLRTPFEVGSTKGYVEGTLLDQGVAHTVSGVGFYKKYGDN